MLAMMTIGAASVAARAMAAELLIEDLREGEGAAAASGHEVTVHYDGWLEDGTLFDSSRARGQPFGFRLGAGRVIRGWEIGIEGMKVGGQRRLTIPPDHGYGDRDLGIIPPNSTLVFEVELLGLE